MSTFMFSHLGSTRTRWDEVDTLINHADLPGASREIAAALCRASVVMLVAHFEGFLKDTVRAVIDDMNTHSVFHKVPSAAQRIFCRIFTGTELAGSEKTGRDANRRETLLMELLRGLNAKLSHAPFVEGTANPKPDVIIRLCKNFGVSNIFSLIDGSRLDDVFSGDPSSVTQMASDIESHLLERVSSFPYVVDLTRYAFDTPKLSRKTGETLWQTFVNDLLAQRHAIAHGASLNNSKSTKELREVKDKTMVLSYGIALGLCSVVSPTPA